MFGPPKVRKIYPNKNPEKPSFHVFRVQDWFWASTWTPRSGGELGGRHAGFAARDAKTLFEMQSFRISGAKPACRPTIFTGRPAVFASRVAKPECRTTIFTGRPGRLLFPVLLFHRFQAEVFASHLSRNRVLLYCFTISFPCGSRQRLLHLGSRNLNVEPPFSPVGRTVYYFT